MKKLLVSLAFLFVLSGSYAHAQTATPAFCKNGTCTYIALEPLPLGADYQNCYGGVNEKCSNPVPFQALVTRGFQLLLGVGSTIAVVMLVMGALTYMFSDVLNSKKNALGRIRNAMWAIVLLVSCYLILNTINPDLVTFKLDLTAIGGQPTQTQPTVPGGVTTQTQTTQTQGQIQTPPTQEQINQCQASGGQYHLVGVNFICIPSAPL
ncbi:MAG: hypothetical protein KA066_01200 [Candidatus Pacebacteria bacterium]|nr:hypothetical protein [Candidatus Paceibacterota bacterium]